MSPKFAWTEQIEYVSKEISQRLGLLWRIKSLLPRSASILFYNSLFLSSFDSVCIVWGCKDNAVLVNNLQLLQNKATKTILDRLFHLSATDALGSPWLVNLGETQTFSSLPLPL